MGNKYTRLAVWIGALAFCAVAKADWPERPIRLIVPHSPGVGGDLIIRQVSENVAKLLGQTLIVENREGAGGNVGTMAAARAAPDGYTFLVAQTTTFFVNQHLYSSFAVDPVKAFTPIIQLGNTPSVLLTNVNVAPNDFHAFAAYAKAQRGKVNFGTAGVGTVGQLTLETVNQKQGLGITSVVYRGSAQVLAGLLSGELQAGFALPGIATQYIQAGKVRPLAVLGTKRLASLPDTPSFSELGFDRVRGETWWALVAPIGTPEFILERMNNAFRQSITDPFVRKRLEDQGVVPIGGTREEIAQKWTSEAEYWARVVRDLGIPRID